MLPVLPPATPSTALTSAAYVSTALSPAEPTPAITQAISWPAPAPETMLLVIDAHDQKEGQGMDGEVSTPPLAPPGTSTSATSVEEIRRQRREVKLTWEIEQFDAGRWTLEMLHHDAQQMVRDRKDAQELIPMTGDPGDEDLASVEWQKETDSTSATASTDVAGREGMELDVLQEAKAPGMIADIKNSAGHEDKTTDELLLNYLRLRQEEKSVEEDDWV